MIFCGPRGEIRLKRSIGMDLVAIAADWALVFHELGCWLAVLIYVAGICCMVTHPIYFPFPPLCATFRRPRSLESLTAG